MRPVRVVSLALLLLPVLAPTIDRADGPLHAARQYDYDDTTSGAIPHPEVVFAVGSAPMQLAQQMAKDHWGTDPCGGQVEVVWTQLTPSLNAQSFWTNSRGSYDAPELNADCQVKFNTLAPFDWPKFCTVAVHEYGHLAGKQHSPDPDDVMAAYYSVPLAECVARTPPQFRPAPPRARPHVRKRRVRHAKRQPRTHRRVGSVKRRTRRH